MISRLCLWLLSFSLLAAGPVPLPKDHFGFRPGDDYKLADYSEIISYYQKLAKATDRMKLIEFGKSSEGKPMYLAVFSSPENLARLDEYREINRKLTLAEVSEAEAHRLAHEAKAFVWIDSGLHATEVAPVQHSPELAYKMATDESDEMHRILHNVILLQVPCINPDGLDHVVHWYRENVGTPFELASLPMLYQKYAGHDNNRDWFMLNLPETRNVSRLLFREWFPQIVYNQHQAPPFPARIFVPPYGEPLNPNIPAPVMEGINMIGAAMKERFATENKSGVVSYLGFDAWWNGGLRSVPAFHNMHGILTEVAGFGYATPHEYPLLSIPERFSTGIPARVPSVFYERPWLGGHWNLKDAIDYMLTADFAILDLASTRAEQFAYKAYETARANIERGSKGKPYAFVVAPTQWDQSVVPEMLRRLKGSGVQIERAKSGFQAGGKAYPSGALLMRAAQPFRGYLLDLMEVQTYPELRNGTNGTVKRPYDVAGWTLPMQMNVAIDRIEEPFTADLEPLQEVSNYEPKLQHNENSSFLAIASALDRGEKVVLRSTGKLDSGAAAEGESLFTFQRPRLAVYEPFTANIDTGWTEWLLDYYRVPYTVVHNKDIQAGGLREHFDAVILAAQSPSSLVHGFRDGERALGAVGVTTGLQRPEYSGGLGTGGLFELERFVRQGGTLITFDTASDLVLDSFPVPVRDVLHTTATAGADPPENSGWYCPGSLLHATVDTSNPIAFGMPKEIVVFSDGGAAFETTLDPDLNHGARQIRSVVNYAKAGLLASGFLQGERAAAGRSLLTEARLGDGRLIMFGFRPQHRGQTFGTFKLVLNAIYLASAIHAPM